jgi:protein-tyrosine phosphatase
VARNRNISTNAFYLARPMCDRGSTALPLIVDELIAFLDRVRAANARVLVHCEWGINRSATATLAYLVRRCDMTLRDALKHCRARRRVTQPLNAYIEQLATLERQWFPDSAPDRPTSRCHEVPAIFEARTQS